MSRLVIISNRLPFAIDKSEEGEIMVRQSSGGLVSAIKSYFEQYKSGTDIYSGKIWVGTMESAKEEWEAAIESGLIKTEYNVEPVFPDKDLYQDYYNGFSNSTLWPLFHYFPSLIENRQEYFEAYKKINLLFAGKIIEIYQPGDII